MAYNVSILEIWTNFVFISYNEISSGRVNRHRVNYTHNQPSFSSYDASEEPEDGSGISLGRLVNHDNKNGRNAKMKLLIIKNMPILCLFALKDIPAGQEIMYDYGGKNYPWMKKVCFLLLLIIYSSIIDAIFPNTRT